MKTIHRIEFTDAVNLVKLPIGANPLHIACAINNGVGHERVNMWYECDDENTFELRKFIIFGTGADLSVMDGYNPRYIGTAIKKNQWAMHVYEVDNNLEINL